MKMVIFQFAMFAMLHDQSVKHREKYGNSLRSSNVERGVLANRTIL